MSDLYTNNDLPQENADEMQDVVAVSGLYENWFLDYASYVILDRAIPAVEDGLKPVQRRIMHAMYDMHDGRFHKVANIIGQTMQYHPHGDASIGDALVNLGQKNLLVDTQGNWGDINTGDSAAAPRYIEARLSKFAIDVLFNPQTTHWQLSYDGRKKEPITLPAKFPLLLAQGVEGIAVGLATKILPHNFVELIDASIDVLKGKEVSLMPDFPTGGLVDCSAYNGGAKGGKVKVRAKIEQVDKKTLVIRELPYGTTTGNLIDSILKANDSGKIKIRQVIDNTAENVEILIHLAAGISPDVTESALYAFTDCEMSISTNACIIVGNKPVFLSVNDMLKISTQKTLALLQEELKIREGEIKEKLLFSSLEKLFIQHKIYRKIEEAETWEDVLQTIRKGLSKFEKDFFRPLQEDDILRLTEIKIKRISKYDSEQAEEAMLKLKAELEQVEFNLAHLNGYAINYFKELRKKYATSKERRTQIQTFDTIQATVVAANNAKLYVDRKEGFVGLSLKKDEFVCDCSDIDDIIVFRKDGVMKVCKVADKVFVGKDILYVNVFRKNDEATVYNMAYLEGETGISFVKRFQVVGITRDKEYNLGSDTKGSKMVYFSANPNGETENIKVTLSPSCKAKNKTFEFDFATLEVKGRSAKGNILTKYLIKSIKVDGKSESVRSQEIWYDDKLGILNRDKVGAYLGKFTPEDKIITFYKDGQYEIRHAELTNRYDAQNILLIERFDAEKVVSLVYFDGNNQQFYAKRFKIETSTLEKRFAFINGNADSKILALTTQPEMNVEFVFKPNILRSSTQQNILRLSELDEVKGWKSVGKKLDDLDSVKFWELPPSMNDTELESSEGVKMDLF